MHGYFSIVLDPSDLFQGHSSAFFVASSRHLHGFIYGFFKVLFKAFFKGSFQAYPISRLHRASTLSLSGGVRDTLPQ